MKIAKKSLKSYPIHMATFCKLLVRVKQKLLLCLELMCLSLEYNLKILRKFQKYVLISNLLRKPILRLFGRKMYYSIFSRKS